MEILTPSLTQRSLSAAARFTSISDWYAILTDRAKRVLLKAYGTDGSLDFKPSSILSVKIAESNARVAADVITGTFPDLTFFDPINAGPSRYAWGGRALDSLGVERTYYTRSDKTQLAAIEATAGPVHIILLTGESTASGGSPNGTPLNMTSAIETHRCLMLSGGGGGVMADPLLTDFDPASVNDFEPVKESGADGRGETPLTACVNWRDYQILADNRPRKTFVVRTHAKRGATLAQIVKGTAPYANGIAEATRIVEMFRDVYKRTCIVDAVFCITGVNDRVAGTSRASITSQLVTMQANYDTDLKAVTAQTANIPLVISQLRAPSSGSYSANVALGQLDAVELDDTKIQIFMSEHELQGAYGMADSVHDFSPGYDVRGVYIGKWLYDVKDAAIPVTYKGMRFRSIAVVDTTHVDVRFWVPVEPIVINTTRLPDFGQAGFRYTSTQGGVTVTAAAVQTVDTIRLTLSGDIGAHTNRFIGFADVETGASDQTDRSKVWGNVCDSDARVTAIIPGLTGLTVPNFAGPFRKGF